MLPTSGFRHAFALVALISALPACGGVEGPAPVPLDPPDPPVHTEPPAPGPKNPPVSSDTSTFAFHTIRLGDRDRDGTLNRPSGWKHYGYDLDGKISTGTSTDVCKPRAGALVKYVHPDGEGGIDNGFGHHLLPILFSVWADVTEHADESLAAGSTSVLLQIDGLGPDASYDPLAARAYEAAPLGKPALFDGTDVWPVRPESLLSPGDLATSTAFTESAYLVDDTWVARMHGTLVLSVPIPRSDGKGALRMPIYHPLVTMTLDPSRQHGKDGTLAGVIPIEALMDEVRKLYHLFDESCDPSKVQYFVDEVEKAADILLDGSQDPERECDAVSIGVGFEAARVALGGVGEAVPSAPSCP